MDALFDRPVEFLKGVGPQRSALLGKELKIFCFRDLLHHYPFRYEDRTLIYKIGSVHDGMSHVQVIGKITDLELIGTGYKKRLVAKIQDETGELELVWFQGIAWAQGKIKKGIDYIVFGKPSRYGNRVNIAHPEMELYTGTKTGGGLFQPVYPITENLRKRYVDSKALSKWIKELLYVSKGHIHETLPKSLLQKHHLVSRDVAFAHIHFPENQEMLSQAQARLKFEELFYVQLRLLKLKWVRIEKCKGQPFHDTSLLTVYYNNHLPFPLTNAQKRVIREIFTDLKSGKQMNRLLQGDVGSGKTIVAFIAMLLIISSGAQCALMAPTEILAQQHFKNIQRYASALGIHTALLTGSAKKKERDTIYRDLMSGELKILIGTHALLEEKVQFNNLGLAIIDEQHRFGVGQRLKLWQKNETYYPHVLVMTATPIPRTLAMTLYGDLDISIIDELPPGRKPIKTFHRYDSHRLQVNRFLKDQIKEGRQVYVVYPLIEESEKLDLKHLMDGYESVTRAFPDIAVSIVHGKMKPEAKDFEMARFIKGETNIMVATTVIEVGVDVPNATVMVIENAERFGLSQLHQLRGRVGRGGSQSYCLLMTSLALGADSRKRIETMVASNNGFEIAEVDLKLRGPGDITGTQQSGILDLMIADISKDGNILALAREEAVQIIKDDPEFQKIENFPIAQQLKSIKKTEVNWSRIS